jgi:hypothetical protein
MAIASGRVAVLAPAGASGAGHRARPTFAKLAPMAEASARMKQVRVRR